MKTQEKDAREPANPLLLGIYEELRYRKKVKNQTDFAMQLGYSKGYVSEVLNHYTEIPNDIAGSLQTVFGINNVYIESKGEAGEMFLPAKRELPEEGGTWHKLDDYLLKKSDFGTKKEEQQTFDIGHEEVTGEDIDTAKKMKPFFEMIQQLKDHERRISKIESHLKL